MCPHPHSLCRWHSQHPSLQVFQGLLCLPSSTFQRPPNQPHLLVRCQTVPFCNSQTFHAAANQIADSAEWRFMMHEHFYACSTQIPHEVWRSAKKGDCQLPSSPRPRPSTRPRLLSSSCSWTPAAAAAGTVGSEAAVDASLLFWLHCCNAQAKIIQIFNSTSNMKEWIPSRSNYDLADFSRRATNSRTKIQNSRKKIIVENYANIRHHTWKI